MEENQNASLHSVTVNDLIYGISNKRLCFVVPSYQRGYRWTKSQVNRLLTDLFDFRTEKEKGNKMVGDFYCLQPIVVKKLENVDIRIKLGQCYNIDPKIDYFEIVDGQQRMTTVFILLKYLLDDMQPYDIEFERDKEKQFARKTLLNSLCRSVDLSSFSCDYADAYYIVQAFKAIKDWFHNTSITTKNSSLSASMTTILREKTQVIWYELDSDADCYNIFKNINHGKIPLTDAELVKAMLLNSKHFVESGANAKIVKQEQDRYARLWDEIQKALCNKDMWSFVTGGGSIDLPTNIDFLIRLIVTKECKTVLDNSDYKYFSYFENKLAEATEKRKYVESVFESLKTTFRTIQDWFDNYRLHNYIGFLLSYSAKNGLQERIQLLIELMKQYETLTKSDFIDELRNRISQYFTKFNINDINYEENQKNVERLLMIFNIEELNEQHLKFNFSVDDNGWSIEHIKAQHSEITQADKRTDYLTKEKESLIKLLENTGDDTMKEKINTIIPQIDALLVLPDVDESEFKRVAELIDREIDGFDEIDMHRLGNLALLSKSDNSSLGNRPFYQKRESINSWINDFTKNIPNSTKKAFSKMYSPQEYALDFTRWRKSDFDAMFSRQKEMLKDFIQGC